MRSTSSAFAVLVSALVSLAVPLAAQGSAPGTPLDPPSRLQKPVHDALHYQVALQIPDTGSQLVGEAAILLRLGAALPIVLDLDARLDVDLATAGGSAPWRRSGDQLVIPHTRQHGDTLTVRVRWHGAPPDGLRIGTNRFGERTVFADNYPDRARRWMPVQDHPSDKASISWRIESGAGVEAIANGVLQRVDTLPSGRLVWHYHHPQPVPTYVMVAGVAAFARQELPPASCAVKCVPQAVWSYRGDSAYAITGPFRHTTSMLDFFSALIAPFPYARLSHVESTTLYGGMENASAIFYGDRLYEAKRLGEETVAHEIVHQWFGDAVTPDDFTHVWLSEGFATYFAALWAGVGYSDIAFRTSMEGAADQIRTSKATEQPILGPLPENLAAILSTNPYQKGSWTLHSLRRVVGDSAFFRGVRRWYTAHEHGNARTTDFQAAMERASGQDLGWYFTQALAQPGYPKLEIRWKHEARARRLVVEVTQTQPAAWGLYRLPKFELQLDDGRRVTIDIAAAGEQLLYVSGVRTAPGTVTADPDAWWLSDLDVSPIQ